MLDRLSRKIACVLGIVSYGVCLVIGWVIKLYGILIMLICAIIGGGVALAGSIWAVAVILRAMQF